MKDPINQLKKKWDTVFAQGGLAEAPLPDEAKGNLGLRKASPRSPHHGGVQITVRLTPKEKRRLEMMALREDVSLGELVTRMLALYEEKHGRVELSSRSED